MNKKTRPDLTWTLWHTKKQWNDQGQEQGRGTQVSLIKGDVNEERNMIREKQQEGKTRIKNKTGNETKCKFCLVISKTFQCPQFTKDYLPFCADICKDKKPVCISQLNDLERSSEGVLIQHFLCVCILTFVSIHQYLVPSIVCQSTSWLSAARQASYQAFCRLLAGTVARAACEYFIWKSELWEDAEVWKCDARERGTWSLRRKEVKVNFPRQL